MDQSQHPPAEESIGHSEAFQAFQQRLSKVAKVERPVLLLGERGSGKELAAARLHYLSNRWNEPLVTLNCAALTPSLITAELFGHEAGAFTGAGDRRHGRFETANRGTLFLDEIGNIPIEAQEKILRVVEYGTFERVGASKPIRVDVRIIGATNADLENAAKRGTFKPDLLDRLSFEVLHLPPLRDRHGDIQLLVRHFATRMAVELGLGEVPAFGDAAQQALEMHAWPGNIRELKNVVERAVYRSEGRTIDTIAFNPFQPTGAPRGSSSGLGAEAPPGDKPIHLPCDLKREVSQLERALLERALLASRHNQRKAAAQLGLTYNQFRSLYRKHHRHLAED